MEIRPLAIDDAARSFDIDATIDSNEYLHIDRQGEGLTLQLSLDVRPLRERLIQSNRLTDELNFLARQIAAGADDGLALVAEHDRQLVALLIAQADTARSVLEIHDLRVDHDFRRQGIGSALIYQAIPAARDGELRAVAIQSRTNNLPAARLLQKCGFELAGLDTRRDTNHDLVKESVSLFWYASLD
jgi:ribosomal protein S18 acetylase RimI-like enzyme